LKDPQAVGERGRPAGAEGGGQLWGPAAHSAAPQRAPPSLPRARGS